MQIRVAQAGALVDEHDIGTRGRCCKCGRAPCLAPTHDQHPRTSMLDVVPARVAGVLVESAEPGNVPQELLVERPGSPRADHRPVVEADRCERPADLVDHTQEVHVELAEDVLRRDDRTLAEWLHAHAHVRDSVHGHHAVRAVARAAEETSPAVVLERPREHAASVREERRADRVASEALELRLTESEPKRHVPVDQLPALRRQSHSTITRGGSARERKRRAPRSSSCPARRGTTPRTRAGAATTHVAARPRCRGSTRSPSARAASATPSVSS